jgi:hypothetical protein
MARRALLFGKKFYENLQLVFRLDEADRHWPKSIFRLEPKSLGTMIPPQLTACSQFD